MKFASVSALLFAASVCAAPSPQAAPTVSLDQGTFVGASDTLTGTNKFLGIPFAQPPVGDLRFRVPVANSPYTGSHNVTAFGPSCIAQGGNSPIPGNVTGIVGSWLNAIFAVLDAESEDCLTLNVFQPTGTSKAAKLPVVAYIYGGGFEDGGTNIYPGGLVVARSVELGQPIIYVSMNYRVAAFGFLAGQEVKSAGVGNLGLQDQRLALKWIQKYISAFGGDPTKVTIWGESAGAISVGLQLVANAGNSENLFRGAFMQSGSPLPVSDITHGQKYYYLLVQQTGCKGTADTLQCLRAAPLDLLKQALSSAPGIFSSSSLNLAWLPRVDGKFLTDNPQQLVLAGKVANVPFVTGDCDDEGTLFSLGLLDLTTDDQVKSYINSNYFPAANSSEMAQLMTLYPSDVTLGSPFDTGTSNVLTPQFKRLAALQGDLAFQGPRRFFLAQVSGKQNTWSFLSKRFKSLPLVGSIHASDLISAYGKTDYTDYIVNFVNNLNPNGNSVPNWPKYNTSSPQLLTFLDGTPAISITTDNYRQSGITFVQQMALKYPL